MTLVGEKRSDLRGFGLRFRYIMAEWIASKSHNEHAKETSEV